MQTASSKVLMFISWQGRPVFDPHDSTVLYAPACTQMSWGLQNISCKRVRAAVVKGTIQPRAEHRTRFLLGQEGNDLVGHISVGEMTIREMFKPVFLPPFLITSSCSCCSFKKKKEEKILEESLMKPHVIYIVCRGLWVKKGGMLFWSWHFSPVIFMQQLY